MRALVLGEHGPELRRDVPRPVPGPGEALVRVRLAGICATDLELIRGYKGFRGVLGHEFVGEVEEALDPAWVGRRVVGSINVGCGECEECEGSGPEHCPRRRVLGILGMDGAFADYLVLPLANLHAVPDSVADEEAVFAEPLAAACRVLEQVPEAPSLRSAVLGPGRLGLLVAQVLAHGGSDVTVLGRREESLALPRKLGLVASLTADPDSFDLVVDATGNPEGLSQALKLVRPRGTVVLKTSFHGLGQVDANPLVVKEICVLGSRCGPLPKALDLLEAGAVQVRPLIDGELSLDEAVRALEAAGRAGVLKVLLLS